MYTKLHCISATAEVFVWQRGKDFATVYAVSQEKTVSRTPEKTRMSIADVTVACVKIYGLIASTVFTVPGLAEQEKFTVQNCC
jgi:hypothetical protein